MRRLALHSRKESHLNNMYGGKKENHFWNAFICNTLRRYRFGIVVRPKAVDCRAGRPFKPVKGEVLLTAKIQVVQLVGREGQGTQEEVHFPARKSLVWSAHTPLSSTWRHRGSDYFENTPFLVHLGHAGMLSSCQHVTCVRRRGWRRGGGLGTKAADANDIRRNVHCDPIPRSTVGDSARRGFVY